MTNPEVLITETSNTHLPYVASYLSLLIFMSISTSTESSLSLFQVFDVIASFNFDVQNKQKIIQNLAEIIMKLHQGVGERVVVLVFSSLGHQVKGHFRNGINMTAPSPCFTSS